MQVGMIGLGRMGANMVQRWMADGHEVVVLGRSDEKIRPFIDSGASGTTQYPEFAAMLQTPRMVWVMVPAGDATEQVITELTDHLEPDDIVIDGGNSYFKDDVRRAGQLKRQGIHYVDVGTSGGIWGRERGYCLMIGGEPGVVAALDPLFKSLAPGLGSTPRTPGRLSDSGTAEHGYLHCGSAGSGHFVKMIHNGIEYGLMQAYAEGFDILRNAENTQLPDEFRYSLNLTDIAEVWRRGSVISSWLLDLTAAALTEDPDLDGFSGIVQDSGEGRWTIQTAIEESVPADVLATALFTRFRSRQSHTFAEKILSAMRSRFGGHQEPTPR